MMTFEGFKDDYFQIMRCIYLEMSLKMECNSKWNVTQDGMSLTKEFPMKWNVTENEMSLETECHSKWSVTKNAMSLKFNVTQNGM